jgi:hypothetical protein
MSSIAIRGLTVICLVTLSWLPLPWRTQDVSASEPFEELPEQLLYLYSRERDQDPSHVQRQLYAAGRRWEQGRVLKVCFFGGNEVVAALVRESASEWNKYSGVRLDFGPMGGWYNCLDPRIGHSQVRIGFYGEGYWSAIGTDSEMRFDPQSPTMNFEGFNRLYSSPRLIAGQTPQTVPANHISTIKHEFGHALGLLHEHQNPKLGCRNEIRFTGPGNIYEFYGASPNFWPPDRVDRNIGFIEVTDPDYVSGEADPKSIMMYAFPQQVLLQGRNSPCFAGANHAISVKDQRIVAKLYPVAATPQQVNDTDLRAAKFRPVASSIAQQESEDLTSRVLADLESDDAYVRRDARARLADILAKLSQPATAELIKRSAKGSYRFQLGVALAINHASPQLTLSQEARTTLSAQALVAKDPTLKAQLGLASKRK